MKKSFSEASFIAKGRESAFFVVRIEQLNISNLRIIEAMYLEPGPGINLVTGYNGAGKTTILEAIHLLGNGRSFRHPEAGPLLREGADSALVTGKLVEDGGSSVKLGVQRKKKEFIARKGGEAIHRRSELLRQLPLQLLLPVSHEIVEKGPELRRRFLDQGLFHVEQSYHRLVVEYGRTLKQRNAALRTGDVSLVRSFNPLLASIGEQINALRGSFVEVLEKELAELLVRLEAQEQKVSLEFIQGWAQGKPLLEILERNESADIKHGFTAVGPHRADIRFRVNGKAAASKVLSRGQQKLLVYGLVLGYLEMARKAEQEVPVLLIDDLDAEFDARRIDAVLDQLEDFGLQTLITTLKGNDLKREGYGVFHVEQGRLSVK